MQGRPVRGGRTQVIFDAPASGHGLGGTFVQALGPNKRHGQRSVSAAIDRTNDFNVQDFSDQPSQVAPEVSGLDKIVEHAEFQDAQGVEKAEDIER